MEEEKSTTNGDLEKDIMVGKKRLIRISDLSLRLMALIFTLVATILIGLDKQTTLVPVQVLPSMPPINVPVIAKWQYMSAFTYFVVINAMACSYGAVSLILILTNRGSKNGVLTIAILLLDLVMVAMLASSLGAASAIGMMGIEGNSHVHWDKVCDTFGKFCHQVEAAGAMSLFGSLAFLFMVMLAILDLHKKHKC